MINEICEVCGNNTFQSNVVLQAALIEDWELSGDEVNYINRQQAYNCMACNSNLRSRSLARSILSFFKHDGTFISLKEKLLPLKQATPVHILELNEAASLSSLLSQLPNYTFGKYPEVDMMAMSYASNSFDLVVHSDTLEHVPDPILALSECYRILKPAGACMYTVPTIVGRMSRSRHGLPKSYHGDYAAAKEDYIVYTEFGADFWTYPAQAGFAKVQVDILEYPAAMTMVCYK
jgi:SAM-dependent methyltransferase